MNQVSFCVKKDIFTCENNIILKLTSEMITILMVT